MIRMIYLVVESVILLVKNIEQRYNIVIRIDRIIRIKLEMVPHQITPDRTAVSVASDFYFIQLSFQKCLIYKFQKNVIIVSNSDD